MPCVLAKETKFSIFDRIFLEGHILSFFSKRSIIYRFVASWSQIPSLFSLYTEFFMFRYIRLFLFAWLFLSCAAHAPALTETYVVQRGDSLWEIADQFSMSVTELKRSNGLRSHHIYPGQRLLIRSQGRSTRSASGAEYVVRRGDSLSKIAARYSMSVTELKRLNGLRSNNIYPGQRLRTRSAVQPSRFRPSSGYVEMDYVVRRGDTLSKIAAQYSMGLTELKRSNGIRSDRIHVGQRLKIRTRLTKIAMDNGPYYFSRPKAAVQRSRRYREVPPKKPIEDYRSARNLMGVFNASINSDMRRDGRSLNGWRIVLDPGHGGRDPGAIVSNLDGNNRSVYVVEDEFVYDIALRLYQKLRLAGAEVEMTVVSPNHLIRENNPPSRTFVHEQNEVYNDASANRRNSFSVRPGLDNIVQRVKIANRFFARRGKTLFISLHADNTPNRPKGPLVIYWSRRGKIDSRSRAFARIMERALDLPDVPAQIGGRNLAVLRGNLAQAEILVEIRNVHHKGEAWALRSHKMRDSDADRIFRGILNYAKRY